MTAAVYPPTMNTAFPTAPPPVTAPSLSPPQNVDQQLRYIQQSQYTPPASASGTPSNTSPTSPRTSWSLPPHMQPRVQQIRPPKSPMYVPAVLRPTEKPLRQSPPKNATATKYGSPDSLGEGSGQVPVSPGPVPGMSRVITDELNEEALGAVTGRPSRDHWKVRTLLLSCRGCCKLHHGLCVSVAPFSIGLVSGRFRKIRPGTEHGWALDRLGRRIAPQFPRQCCSAALRNGNVEILIAKLPTERR